MRKYHGPVLGISFTEDTIRIVATQPGRSGAVEVTHVISAPVPRGAFQDRILTDPGLISAALQAMLRDTGITTRAAVIGLPSWDVFSRVITIPPVLEKERQTVVRGEIDHLNILPPGQGAFDFALFARPQSSGREGGGTGGSASPKGDPVLFFAAEQPVVESFRAAVADAGLKVVGMEPADYAAIRAAYLTIASKPLAVAISLGVNSTHLQFFQQGQPIYSRRLDVGIDQMTVPEASLTPGHVGAVTMTGIGEQIGRPVANAGDTMVDALFDDKRGQADVSRQRLALEIGRSLDYLSREYVADLTGLYAVLLPNDLRLAGLPVYVTAALEQEVDFAYAFEHVRLAPKLPKKLLEEEGVAYAPALGLALGPLVRQSSSMPVFDLSADANAAARDREMVRFVGAAAVGAAAIIAVGAGFAFFLEQRHQPVRDELRRAQQTVQTLSQEEGRLRADITQQQDLVRQIRSREIPWTNVLRSLALAAPPGVALTGVSVQNSTLSINGETVDPRRIPMFWGTMNRSSFFVGANVTSITQDNAKVTFQMTANLPTAPNIAAEMGR